MCQLPGSGNHLVRPGYIGADYTCRMELFICVKSRPHDGYEGRPHGVQIALSFAEKRCDRPCLHRMDFQDRFGYPCGRWAVTGCNKIRNTPTSMAPTLNENHWKMFEYSGTNQTDTSNYEEQIIGTYTEEDEASIKRNCPGICSLACFASRRENIRLKRL